MKRSKVLQKLQQKAQELLKYYPNLGEQLQKYHGYISGGCWVSTLLGQPNKDIDIYFDSVEHAEGFANEYKCFFRVGEKTNLRVRAFECMRFVTYPSATECINDFDFSCCQIAWDGNTFYFGEHTLKDIGDKYLRLLDIHAPLIPTLQRIIKYINKGFKPDEHTFGMICKHIKQNGVDNIPMKFEAYQEEALPDPFPQEVAQAAFPDLVRFELARERQQVERMQAEAERARLGAAVALGRQQQAQLAQQQNNAEHGGIWPRIFGGIR